MDAEKLLLKEPIWLGKNAKVSFVNGKRMETEFDERVQKWVTRYEPPINISRSGFSGTGGH